jgi:hypothetical protein
LLLGKRFKCFSLLLVMAVFAFVLLAHIGLASASNALAAPRIMPDGGSFKEPTSVNIFDADVGDPIYYTTDGSDPETSGTHTVYAGAFIISQSETVETAVYDTLFGWSSEVSAAFTIVSTSSVQEPVISPNGGSFTNPQTVTITGIPSGDTCYYSTDGTIPENGNTPYTGPFTVSQSERINAVNYSPASGYSGATQADFYINSDSLVAAPTISPNGGAFTTAKTVTINGSTGGCFYTTDGSDPRTSSTSIWYQGPFTMWSGTVKAANYSGGLFDQWSSVTSATFTDSGYAPPAAPSFSPGGGSFDTTQTVTITGIPSGDLCYYSLEGNQGGQGRTLYTGPLTVNQPETIEAANWSESDGWSTTTVANFVIGISLAISPDGGTFNGPQTVTITGIPSGCACIYTTDGADPINGPLGDGYSYTGPFTVSQSETIKAATSFSSVVSAIFVINGSQTVAITPDGGSFGTAQSVTITGIPSGDTCYYTTDGSNPTTTSTAVTYNGAFTVSQSETVQAAIHDPTSGWGGVTTATFTIGGVPSSQAPIITPNGGTFTAPQSVTVTGIPDGDICYYSTDGATPRYGSCTPYIGPFTVSQSETVYVANQNQAGDWGDAASATFTINNQATVPAAGTLTPGEITTVAGNNAWGYSGDNGPATSAWLDSPNSVAVDASGNLYIADTSNNRIRKVAPSGAITTVAGNGTAGYSGDGGPATSAELDRPYGVAVDQSGNLYIADTYNQRIRKVSTSGAITTVAGNGHENYPGALNGGGYSGDGGLATDTELNAPLAVAVDQSGNLYIADTYNQRIRKVSASGAITTVAGNGQGGTFGGYSGDGGPATGAELAQPTGVAVDASGNIYIISDQYNNCIRKVDSSGAITTVGYGGSIQGYSGQQVLSTTNAATSLPAGVAVDASGNLYCAYGYDCVRRIDPDTGTSAIVAGKVNNPGYSGDGGPATGAELNCPDGVTVDSSGDIFIADNGNNRIREVKATGQAASLPSLNASTSTASLSTEQTTSSFTVGQSSYAVGGQSFAMDAAPFISNGRFLAPVLYLADALNAQTSWDAATRTITVIKGGTTIELAVGSMAIATNGKTSQMDVSPLIEDGRTYLPARYVAEALGYKVSWEAEAQAITVSQQST